MKFNNESFFKGLALGLLITVIAILFISEFGFPNDDRVKVDNIPDRIFYPLSSEEPIVILLSNNPTNTQLAGQIQIAMTQIQQSKGGTP
jgi:hypothetical protein